MLGFVFQDPSLLPWLNLEGNVGFGLDFKHQPDIDKAQKAARIAAAIAEVDLLSAKERYPSELSGRMAQRAARARILARPPEIPLLDEHFTHLDATTRHKLHTI